MKVSVPGVAPPYLIKLILLVSRGKNDNLIFELSYYGDLIIQPISKTSHSKYYIILFYNHAIISIFKFINEFLNARGRILIRRI